MKQIRSTIFGKVILDNLWPKILLTMIYISNLLPTSALNRLCSYKISIGLLPSINYL